MKVYKYLIESIIDGEPTYIPKTTTDEAMAKRESYNGKYEPYDDGQPETYQPTDSERLAVLEEALLELMGVSVDD